MNKFEKRPFGIHAGFRGKDDQSPPIYCATTELDAVGHGHGLVRFRGKFVNPLWRKNKLRHESGARKRERFSRDDRFLNKNYSTEVS